MASLWADGWFYISAGGFLVSCVLFVFLLGQYRAAVEAEDDDVVPDGPALVPAPSPQEKVYVPKAAADSPKPTPVAQSSQAAPAPLKSVAPAAVPAPKPAEPLVSKPAAAPSAESFKKADTTGPLSPAVVYLQNLKGQMERLEKDITGLKAMASQHVSHNETVLKRLAELAQKLESRAEQPTTVAAANAAAAAPKPVESPMTKSVELEPQRPAPSTPSPAKAEPLRTIELEISAAAASTPESKPAAATPESDKTMVIEPTVAPIKLSEGKAIPLPTRPGFEPESAAPAEPVQPPQEKTDKPTEPENEPSPKPARKGPVWPI